MKSRFLMVAMAALLMVGSPALAYEGGSGKNHAQMKERMANMTPEQKAAAKAKMKEKFKTLPPERQEAIMNKLKAKRGGAE